MPNKRHILLYALLFACLLGLAYVFVLMMEPASDEPRYHGRTLTSWLEQFDWSVRQPGLPVAAEKAQADAVDAIRQIGTNAIFTLLSLASTENTRPKCNAV